MIRAENDQLQKTLLSDINRQIVDKKTREQLEREERIQAGKRMEEVAQYSLSLEGKGRKEMLSNYRKEFAEDYGER